MSGGCYDYGFRKIYDLADSIPATTPLRKAFKTHLSKVAKACHDIEWVDSGDYGTGFENESIRDCFSSDVNTAVLSELLADAKAILEELSTVIREIENK